MGCTLPEPAEDGAAARSSSSRSSAASFSPSSPLGSSASSPDAIVLTMEAGNFYFAPAAITVRRGQAVTILFDVSEGTHDFVIDALGVNSGLLTEPNPSVTFTPRQAGTFVFYCSVPGHREQGMEGTITVTE